MRRWDGLVERYLEGYAARGVSGERVKGVRRELDRWGSWLKGRRPRPRLESVDADLVIRYVRERTTFRAKGTVSGQLSVLRGMGEFLVREGLWSSNPLRWIRGPRLDPRCRLPKRLGPQLMKRLWEGVVTHRQGYHRHLWLTILALLYGTGLRRGELVRLDVADWDRDEGLLRVDGRKTGRARRVPVPELVGHCLESYLPQRHNQLERMGMPREQALFVNKAGGRVKGPSVSRGIHKIARRAGVPLVSLHQFRHTCASDLLEAGLALPAVQAVLGHQVITTTMRYLEISDPQRHQAVRRHPLNEWLAARADEEVSDG
jgi:site-specific recombinase XerD